MSKQQSNRSSIRTGNHFEALEGRELMSVSATNTVTATVYKAVGTANVAATIKAFEAALGGTDNTLATGPQSGGFRTINWDGVKLDGTDFNGQTKTLVANKDVAIPTNRFQGRGAKFDEVYVVSGDGFAALNPNGIGGQINAFSPKNTFGHFNDVDLGMSFVNPSAPPTSAAPKATRGFGAVFVDVEKANSSNIEFQSGSDSLGKFYAPAGSSGQVEFLGVIFSAPVVTHVDVNPGTAAIFNRSGNVNTPGGKDISKGGHDDLAAVDDFIYGEPTNKIQPNILHAKKNVLFNNTVTTFSASQNTTTGLSASIQWGDGTTTVGQIFGSNGQFTIKGSHKYQSSGDFFVKITIKDAQNHTAISSAIANVV